MATRFLDSSVSGSPQRMLGLLSKILETSLGYSIIGEDLDGNIVVWNEDARRIYGYEPEELFGKAGSAILDAPEEIEAGKPREIREAATREGRWEGRVTGQAKDERRFSALVVVAAWRDVAGSPVGFVMTSSAGQNIAEWKPANAALEESQRRFQAIFENALDGMLIIDDTGRYVDANPAICQLLGYGREELRLMTVWDVARPQDRKRIPDLLEQFLAEGTLCDEYALLCKDRTTRDFEYRWVAKILPGLHVAIHRDITERNCARRELRDRHNLLQTLIDCIPEAIYAKDVDGRYLIFNSHGAGMIGRHVEECIGRDDTELFEPETAKLFEMQDRQVMQTGQRADWEAAGTSKGVTRTYSTTKAPFRSADGTLAGVVGISRDISESKALRKDRDRLLERLHLQIRRLPVAYILLDKNYRVLDWNPAAEKMFGYTKMEALGHSCLDLIVQQPLDDEILDVIRRIESGNTDAHNVNENRTKDGGTITCQWYNTPLMDHGGNFAGMICLGQDITERQRAEEHAASSSAALENAVEGIARLDTHNQYVAANRAYAAMLGYQPEELIGASAQTTVHPRHQNVLNGAYHHMRAEGRAEAEVFALRKDGSVFWQQIMMVKAHDQNGGWIGHHCFMRNITRRKTAEEALRESTAQLQSISRRVVEIQEEERRHLGASCTMKSARCSARSASICTPSQEAVTRRL